MFYLSLFLAKFKEVTISVLPITIIVMILHFTITPIESFLLFRFLIGASLVILGLTIFLFGVDLGINPIGSLMGKTLINYNKIWIIIVGGLALGFFITIAEPNLHILAEQVELITANLISKIDLVVVVSLGIAIAIAIGLCRIVLNLRLNIILFIIYAIIFILALFTSKDFIAISFDASGSATGALTVPFILALNLGVSSIRNKQGNAGEESFGLVALSAAFVIMAVLIMSVIYNTDKVTGNLVPDINESTAILKPFLHQLSLKIGDVAIALLPLVILFIIFQLISFKLSKKTVIRVFKGFIYAFIGLVLFLTGVNAGFMEVGRVLGSSLAKHSSLIVSIVAFILGMVTILAEPSVYILTNQIEEVTSGSIKRNIILTTLSLGVGLAVFLSVIRILIPSIELWHFLLVGYSISLLLAFFVPRIFVGISFDSGSVASGPMAATFIFAFSQGVAGQGNLIEGFGILALVTLSPIVALQFLGLIYKIKLTKGGKTHE